MKKDQSGINVEVQKLAIRTCRYFLYLFYVVFDKVGTWFLCRFWVPWADDISTCKLHLLKQRLFTEVIGSASSKGCLKIVPLHS